MTAATAIIASKARVTIDKITGGQTVSFGDCSATVLRQPNTGKFVVSAHRMFDRGVKIGPFADEAAAWAEAVRWVEA